MRENPVRNGALDLSSSELVAPFRMPRATSGGQTTGFAPRASQVLGVLLGKSTVWATGKQAMEGGAYHSHQPDGKLTTWFNVSSSPVS